MRESRTSRVSVAAGAARFAVVGYARKPIADDVFREDMRKGCDEFARRRPVDAELWDTFANHLFYQEGSYDDPAAYAALKKRPEYQS